MSAVTRLPTASPRVASRTSATAARRKQNVRHRLQGVRIARGRAEFLVQPDEQFRAGETVEPEVLREAIREREFLDPGQFSEIPLYQCTRRFGHFARVARLHSETRLGQLADATTLPDRVRHIGRRRRVGVVKALHVTIQRCAAFVAREVRRLKKLKGNFATRREEEEVRQQSQRVLEQQRADMRNLAAGQSEAAAPQPARANQYDPRLRRGLQKEFHRAVAAQIFQLRAIDVSRGIENQVVALAQGGRTGINGGRDLSARSDALLGHALDWQHANAFCKKTDEETVDLILVRQCARGERPPQARENDDRIDQARVIRKKKNPALPAARDVIDAPDAHAVAQPEQRQDQPAQQRVQHGGET